MLTRLSISQTARMQYRLCFRSMASQGGTWSFFINEGALQLLREEAPLGEALLRNVQAMSEEQMVRRLNAAWALQHA